MYIICSEMTNYVIKIYSEMTIDAINMFRDDQAVAKYVQRDLMPF